MNSTLKMPLKWGLIFCSLLRLSFGAHPSVKINLGPSFLRWFTQRFLNQLQSPAARLRLAPLFTLILARNFLYQWRWPLFIQLLSRQLYKEQLFSSCFWPTVKSNKKMNINSLQVARLQHRYILKFLQTADLLASILRHFFCQFWLDAT